MKESNKIEILNKPCTISQQEIEYYMDFSSLWDDYELSKITTGQIIAGAIAAVDRQVIRRALRTASIIIFFGVILIKEDIDIKPAPQSKIIDIPKTQNYDHVKTTNPEPEEDMLILSNLSLIL